jgi:hypothetical protein
MNVRGAMSLLSVGISILFLLLSITTMAQVARTVLSGTISDQAGKGVAGAKVSVMAEGTGQSSETQTDAAGIYIVPNLSPGNYEISVSAEGFSTNLAKVAVAAGPKQTMNLTLGGALSLESLGFSTNQTQGNAQTQARLDKRSHMLKIHQRLGLIAAAPMVASLFTGSVAGGKSSTSTDRLTHMALGSLTGDLYFMSAYYAIRAPTIPGTATHGGIRLHKAMAFIHGPGMILTPILGAIAFEQKSRGEKIHGIASAHGAVAAVTAIAYGVSILSVSVRF